MIEKRETVVGKFNEKLKKAFQDKFKIIALSDGNAGYSLVRDYDKKILDKLCIENGKKYVSLAHLLIGADELDNLDDKDALPVVITINFLLDKNDSSGYGYNYDFVGRRGWAPVNLTSAEDYFYNISEDAFYEKDKKKSIETIYNELFEQHIKPTKRIKGAFLRLKMLFWRSLFPKALDAFSYVSQKLIFIISGEKFSYTFAEHLLSNRSEPNISPQKEEKASKQIEFFGYSASAWSIVAYCLIHLFLFAIFYYYKIRPDYIKLMLTNNFLTLVYVIFSLAIFEKFIPKVLKYIVVRLNTYSFNLQFKRIKI